jgi:CBS-domain-containing membrane protein
LLGRIRRSTLELEPGPSTVRYDLGVDELRERLDERDLKTAIVTTPEGKLVGVVRRTDLA